MKPVTVLDLLDIDFSVVFIWLDGAGEPSGVRKDAGDDVTTASGNIDSISIESSLISKKSLTSSFRSYENK